MEKRGKKWMQVQHDREWEDRDRNDLRKKKKKTYQ
jgi:hypothetical protein